MRDVIRLSGGALVHADGQVWFPHRHEWFQVKAHQLSAAQVEFSAKRPRYYVEGTLDDLTHAQRVQLRAIERGDLPELSAEEEAERKARVQRIAANRAKTRVRKFCKVIGADSLLTLTYRANQTDLALCKKHLREFVRRMRRLVPEFRGVAGFEVQRRGAWHVHMGCPASSLAVVDGRVHQVKSYNLIRAVWRSVVGELGGNIDVQRRKRNSKRSPARIAAYLSKYLLKAFEAGQPYVDRWTRFGRMQMPPVLELGRCQDARQMIVDCFGLVGACTEVVTAVYSHFGDWFYLAAEAPGSG